MTQTNAILCALSGFFFWVASDALVKVASLSNIPPLTIVSILGMAGVIWGLSEASYHRDLSVLRTRHPWRQAIVSLAMTGCLCANAIALKHLPLTIFYIVVFTTPLALAATAALLKHEKLTTGKVFCVIAGFVGVLIVIAPRLVAGGEWIGYIAGLANVVCMVVFTLETKQISQNNTPQSLLFWIFFAMAAIGILFAGPALAAIPLKYLIILIAAGCANTFANGLYNKALRHTSATNVMQLHYTQIIFGAGVGYFLWHEVPTWNLAIGSVLIIASGLVVAAQASKA